MLRFSISGCASGLRSVARRLPLTALRGNNGLQSITTCRAPTRITAPQPRVVVSAFAVPVQRLHTRSVQRSSIPPTPPSTRKLRGSLAEEDDDEGAAIIAARARRAAAAMAGVAEEPEPEQPAAEEEASAEMEAEAEASAGDNSHTLEAIEQTMAERLAATNAKVNPPPSLLFAPAPL
jgi:hypothetical protein